MNGSSRRTKPPWIRPRKAGTTTSGVAAPRRIAHPARHSTMPRYIGLRVNANGPAVTSAEGSLNGSRGGAGALEGALAGDPERDPARDGQEPEPAPERPDEAGTGQPQA